ncbi:hypothetical protein T440DRAFT_166070 [Plenodomus tracheiphilus IPT5]|uniref:Uncharacterized protein n=1 Tax=Plenodomus tracheiphilus IPT5 TaxID=1408161 RepID=A0A6A7AYT3_9PLEO|nr:hypothetical protein T440DRAFT_166070 [Plenodomus tracheiphilus IPT5]
MAEYEELVELGFEGVDKFADKYHDKVYDHLPAVPIGKRRHNQQQQAQTRKTRQDNQRYEAHLENGQQPPPDLRGERGPPDRQHKERHLPNPPSDYQPYQPHPDKGYSRNRSGPPGAENGYRDDTSMSSYGPSPRSERDYQPKNADRYYEDERIYYNGPDPATAVPRGREIVNGMRGQQMTAYQQPPQTGYDQSVYGRPTNQRRGSSWSPPRTSKDNRKNRSQSRTRARSPPQDKKHRLAATLGGALIGGIAGNQAGKGKKYDTAATFIGAIVGGLGAREATEFWDKRQHQKEDQGMEAENGYSDDDRKSERRKEDRYDRDDRYERNDRYDDRYDDGNDRYEREHRNDRRY